MTNKRKEIRHAFIGLLSGKTRAMFSVHNSVNRTIWDEELPAINVVTGDEEPEPAGSAPMRYMRTLEVTLELYLESVRSFQDDMDDFMSEVETLINGQDLFTLSDSVDRIVYLSSHIEPRGETTKESGVATIKYNVVYFTYAGVDSSLLPDLEELDVKWDTTGVTEDIIELPTT